MKKDFKAKLTAAVLALSLAVTPTVSVMAAGDDATAETGSSQTIEGYANPSSPTTVVDGDGNVIKNFSTSSIDVEASILGSSQKIIYSIYIGYGDMQFAYDFGQTWDPVNHVYLNNGSDVSEGGWVTYKHVDGTNNAITVRNDSNYPISVSLSYDQVLKDSGSLFNSNTNNAKSVIGIFNDDNATLEKNVNTADYNGNKATEAAKLTTASFDLDMDYSHLDYGTYEDYGVLDTTNTNSGIYSKTIYFTLCGTPDAASTLTADYESVGTIKVKVTPASDDKVVKRPKS